MPPQVHPYTVFGFSEDLDWCTLHFLRPVDDIRVCSACRVVARKSAFLPCRHVLCEHCYEQLKARGHICVLEGELCPEDEVHWREFPVEKMMKSEVSCWNRENGCQASAVVSSITEHFRRDCAYHSTSCPKCAATVLRRNIIVHLDSHCAKHVLTRRSVPPTSEGVAKEMEDIQTTLQGLDSACRNASHNNASLHSQLRESATVHEEILGPLSTMANEMKKASQTSRVALSAVEISARTKEQQIARLMHLGASLCTQLDEIKRTADKWCHDSSAHEATTERQKLLEDLAVLQSELQSVTIKLEELKKGKSLCGTAKEEGTAALRLSEVSIGSVFFIGSRLRDRNNRNNEPVGTFRIFEEVPKGPSQVVWCVKGWPSIRDLLQADDRFVENAQISILNSDVKGYTFGLTCRKQMIYFAVCVMRKLDAPLTLFPKMIKLCTVNEKVVHMLNVDEYSENVKLGTLSSRWYFSDYFPVRNFDDGASVEHDNLALCFTFLY
ncbi:uncharacterized protein [Dermacentor andersoni]|uniref:uncharacterized protein n=1 Tax=Dermacentor andersoni TaxID=34620 RepID=UPI002417E4C7|nr:uncharacterized protein LOC126543546 [Dermacentor andersoni]